MRTRAVPWAVGVAMLGAACTSDGPALGPGESIGAAVPAAALPAESVPAGDQGPATTPSTTTSPSAPATTSTPTTIPPTTAPPTTIPPTTTIAPLDPAAVGDFGTGVLTVLAVDGAVAEYPVLVAADRARRQQGLMGVTDLAGYAGMAFVFGSDTSTSFWMKDTPMPLSIAFVAVDGEIVSVTDMEPCVDLPDCPSYRPAGPYRFAVEVPQGELPGLGVVPGARLALRAQ